MDVHSVQMSVEPMDCKCRSFERAFRCYSGLKDVEYGDSMLRDDDSRQRADSAADPESEIWRRSRCCLSTIFRGRRCCYYSKPFVLVYLSTAPHTPHRQYCTVPKSTALCKSTRLPERVKSVVIMRYAVFVTGTSFYSNRFWLLSWPY